MTGLAHRQAALAGDDMLVSYCSQHESKAPAANIYVAVVPLKK